MRIPDEHKAKLFKVDQANPGNEPGATSADAVLVQFNPTSLSYSVQNTLEKKGRDANAKQFVAQTTAKLEFDLVFDSTHDGGDVRGETDRIKQFLNPGDKSTNKDQAPALVGFRWGTYLFKGILESFKENLDFFSAEGVPLRSTLKIGLSSQDPKDVFAQLPAGHPDAAASAGGGVSLAALGQRGTSGMAAQGGNAAAGRALAASNGFESMRNPGAGVAAVASGGVQLKAAAGFSAGAPAGVGLGLGLGVGASAGTGVGMGASSLQAFAGLASPRTAAGTPALNTRALLPPAPSPGTAMGSGFALGGQAVSASSSGMKADMGPSARIKFD
jgi:Contractile injection system tube protein